MSVTCNASLRTLGAISRFTRQFSSYACIVPLFCCLIRPKLEFASIVWNCINDTASCSIDRVQKRFIRIVFDRFFGRKFYYNHDRLLKRLGLCTLFDRRRCRDILFLHKLVNGLVDCPVLLSVVCFHAPPRSSRNRNLFYPSTFFHTSPLIRMQHDFNKLDCSLQEIFRTSQLFGVI